MLFLGIYMATKGREYHSEEFDVGQMPAVDLSQSREPDIVLAPDIDLKHDELAEFAFNEEVLTIRLDRSSSVVGASAVPVSVNGESVYIPIGVPVKLKRKFVAVLAWAKQTTVSTAISRNWENESNRVMRDTYIRFPFSVLHDPNPRGHDWLTKLMAF